MPIAVVLDAGERTAVRRKPHCAGATAPFKTKMLLRNMPIKKRNGFGHQQGSIRARACIRTIGLLTDGKKGQGASTTQGHVSGTVSSSAWQQNLFQFAGWMLSFSDFMPRQRPRHAHARLD